MLQMLADARPRAYRWGMPTTDVDAQRLSLWGQAVAKVRKDEGLTQEDLASRMGWTVQNLRAYEAGRRDALSKQKTREKFAGAIGVSMETLDRAYASIARRAAVEHDGFSAPDPISDWGLANGELLPVRDRAQAGAWLPADDTAQITRFHPAAPDRRYGHAQQWLTEVVGDSVDKLRIYNGDLVHCVDLIGSGHRLKTGDIVEVVRFRHDGQERELTIKQVEITREGVLLWPRSSNPRYREPLEILHGLREHEHAEIQVRGLVLHVTRQLI